MKILVTIKQSTILEQGFEVTGTTISEKYLTYELNESDEHAIEEAIQISETADDKVEVVCINIGSARATETVKYALAMGADKAIRVWEDTLDGQTFLNPSVKAEIPAAVARKEDPDLIFAGVQSDDALFGATGVYLARELGLGWAAAVSGFELDFETEVATVERELEGGLEEVLEVDLPAAITVQAGIDEPRYISRRAIYRSNKEPVELDLAELAVDVDDIVNHYPVVGLNRPETSIELLEGDPDRVGQQLMDIFQEQGVVQ